MRGEQRAPRRAGEPRADPLPSAAEPAPAGAFVAETSFSRAPLNSRLPPISPHRAVIAPTSARPHKESRPPRDGEEDDEGGLESDEDGSFEEEDDEEVLATRRKREGLDKEPLAGLSAELQEALIVEDLLFVLMVSMQKIVKDGSLTTLTRRQGIEGQYIEYDPSYTPEDDLERLQGAHFVVDPSLGELGLLYDFARSNC